MKVTNAIAHVLKTEGVEFLIGYPVNPIIEGAAEADIRTIMVRQERIGLHMCDAVAKVTSGDKIGAFVMQHGPGTENAFGGVAQSYGDSCPVVVLPAGYARNINQVHPNFNAALNFRHVTKLSEQVTVADATIEALRRAFTTVRNGRPGPVLVEFPTDILRDEVPDALVAEYKKAPQLRSGPDPQSVSKIAEALVAAQRPVIVAGQGVHYGKAWPQLQALAELLEAPVMTTLPGKSAFPENHPLSLGSGGIGIGEHLWHMLSNADFIFGIGCSFTRSSFATPMPKGKKIAHATVDPYAINKDVPVDLAAVGMPG
jgi:acetolactate synthase-1/2/3 large subunit